MRYLFPLIAVSVVFYGLTSLPIDGAMERGSVSVSIGFLMLSAYFMGKLAEKFSLPRISGYIITGILFGPSILGFVDNDTVSDMRFIDGLALTFIALAAGGELRIKELIPRLKVISLTIVFQVSLIFAGTTLLVYFLGPLFGIIPEGNIPIAITAGLITASVMTARSPSTMIAVISETRARGVFTETVMGVTVAIDVVVLILFTLSVALGELLMVPGTSIDPTTALVLTLEIGGAIAIGAVLGLGLILYIKYVNQDLAVILLILAVLVTTSAHFISEEVSRIWASALASKEFNFLLEPLLISMTTGFVVENFSPRGEKLLKTIDDSSLPLYVIFFALAGASLNLDTLLDAWPFALILLIYRLFALWGGAYASGKLSGELPVRNRWMGVSFMAQAGVSIGIAALIVEYFPEWGIPLASVILAVVAVNQIFGPIILKIALEKVGETGKRDR